LNFVGNLKDVIKNIDNLENIRNNQNILDFREYVKLIKRGTCFYSYHVENEIAFAPSRFIRYKNNSIKNHSRHKSKDGRDTNTSLIYILESNPEPNTELEKSYKSFCQQLGFEPRATGAFGVTRKYWIPIDRHQLLEQVECDSILEDQSIESTVKDQLIKARIGQGRFRQLLINHWNGCAVTKCGLIEIMRASHVHPWRESTNRERLDPFNGLLLSPNLDSLFDKAMISFAPDGKIMISKSLSLEDINKLGISQGMSVNLKTGHERYLSLHRARFLSKDKDHR
jgi:putative restriction endonuclease